MIEKITKLCWNDFKWMKPSGTHGKSRSKNSHERYNGYGHEEWLLDKSKVIKGFHYGFVQALNLRTNLHLDQAYKVWLYSFTEKQKYIVGFIDSCQRISQHDSVEIYKIYKKNGWLREMVVDLETAGILSEPLKNTSPEIFFNVRFKINDVHMFDDYLPLAEEDDNIKISRYKLLDKKGDFKFKELKDIIGYKRKAVEATFINPYHRKIQDTLVSILKKDDRFSKIRKEFEFVDVRATLDKKEIIFYEIKTDTAKNNIRQAIGQLLEYSFFPSETKSDKMIIIGDREPEENVKAYLNKLRRTTSLNIWYQWINMETKLISNKY